MSGKRISVLDGHLIKGTIVLDQSKGTFFLMKKTGDAIGDFEGWSLPVARFSSMNSSSCFCS